MSQYDPYQQQPYDPQQPPPPQYQQPPQYDPRMYPPPGYEVRKRKSFPRRHWFLTFVFAPFVVLILIIVIAVAASSGGNAPTSAAGSSSSSSGASGNVACGADLTTMKGLIAKGDYQDAGSEANDDSTDATRQHAILGSGIAEDYDQLGMDADSAAMDQLSGGATFTHDKSEVQTDLATLERDCT
jgi:hypothetical protein